MKGVFFFLDRAAGMSFIRLPPLPIERRRPKLENAFQACKSGGGEPREKGIHDSPKILRRSAPKAWLYGGAWFDGRKRGASPLLQSNEC